MLPTSTAKAQAVSSRPFLCACARLMARSYLYAIQFMPGDELLLCPPREYTRAASCRALDRGSLPVAPIQPQPLDCWTWETAGCFAGRDQIWWLRRRAAFAAAVSKRDNPVTGRIPPVSVEAQNRRASGYSEVWRFSRPCSGVTIQNSNTTRPAVWEDEAPAEPRFRRVQQGMPPSGRALPGMPLEMNDPDGDAPAYPRGLADRPGRRQRSPALHAGSHDGPTSLFLPGSYRH